MSDSWCSTCDERGINTPNPTWAHLAEHEREHGVTFTREELAAHDTEVAAKALEGVIETIWGKDWGTHDTQPIREWLRDRADAIRTNEGVTTDAP